MSRSKLIGLIGPARSGKNTIARIIMKLHPDARELAFADALYEMLTPLVQRLLPHILITRERLEHLKEGPIPTLSGEELDIREMLQTLGTEWGRTLIHHDLWIMAVRPQIVGHLSRGRMVVVTDVRFENEIRAIRSLGGALWIVRGRGGGLHGSAAAHPSEALAHRYQPQGERDLEIDNSGTLEELEREILKALRRI